MSRDIKATASRLNEQELALRNTEKGRLLFTRIKQQMCALWIQGERLKAVRVLEEANAGKIGGIYIGKVKNVVKNIDACFVEIGKGEICFLPMTEARFPIILNRHYDGRILEGDELPVQVTRDAQKTKQASVTAHIALSNEAFSFHIGENNLRFSNKLSKEDKEWLSTVLAEQGIIAEGSPLSLSEKEGIPSATLVVRTRCAELSPEEIKASWQRLRQEWCTLFELAPHRTCFTCLLKPPAAFVTAIKELVYPQEYEEILTDDQELFTQLTDYCQRELPDKTLRLYQDHTLTLSKLYALESKLDTALNARVWLKSGGYLVIEPTEALTVIDVNSGKYEAKRHTQDMAFFINCDAAREIALQLRLRNLSGIIVIDFINMTSKEQQKELLNLLRNEVRFDLQKTVVVDITPLGLVEITRKKSYKPLKEQFQNRKKIKGEF